MAVVTNVDPDGMLSVTYNDPRRGEVTFAAVSCQYVVVPLPTGERRVALEIVIDQNNPAPRAPYLVAPNHLTRLRLGPRHVLRVEPYR